MILLLLFACPLLYSETEALRDAQTWVGEAGRVRGCSAALNANLGKWICDAVESDGAPVRLYCANGCTRLTPPPGSTP